MPVMPCDGIFDSCGEAELKCMPIPSPAGVWDSYGCVPVADNPGQAGDPCFDSCAPGPGVDDDCGPLLACVGGVCQTLCLDDCGVGEACLFNEADNAGICAQTCDALFQDCSEGQGCYLAPDSLTLCNEEGDVEDTEPCGFVNACEPGLSCAAGGDVPGCAKGQMCCTPFCDLSVTPNPCTAGRTCVAYSNSPTPANSDLGICVLG